MTNRLVRRGAVALAVATTSVLLGASAQAAQDDTTLISVAPGGAAATGGDSTNPSTSHNGQFVAFESTANNLSDDDNDTVSNIYVRNVSTGATIFVSRATGGAAGDGNSADPSISANGRFVAFESDAENLAPEDNNDVTNVFVRDLQTNTTTLVSRASAADGGAGGDGASGNPSISPDGGFVAFDSFANNVSSSDVDGNQDVYVRDLAANTTTLASRPTGADSGGATGGNSSEPSLSLFGASVAFESTADNLSVEDNNAFNNVFVRNLSEGTTTLVSRATGAGGAEALGNSANPSIGAFAGHVAFDSFAPDLTADDPDGVRDVFVRDLNANTTALVSRASGAAGTKGTAASSDPSIAAAGDRVAFESLANELSGEDQDDESNVFVRDRSADTTILASRATTAAGAAADDDSQNASLSTFGGQVAFDSLADNLSTADSDSFGDVFMRDVFGPTNLPPPGGGIPMVGLDVDAKKRQRIGRPIKIEVSCEQPCSIVARGSVKRIGKGKKGAPRSGKLKPETTALGAGDSQRLKLRLTKKAKKALKRADRGRAKVKVKAQDGLGNSQVDRLKIKLR